LISESKLEEQAVEYAKRKGWFVRKVQWIGRRGAPDRVFIRRGKIVWIEFKRGDGTGEVSGNQRQEIRRMREAGADVYVAWTMAEVERVLI
jgi:hypothetical protein